MTQALAILLDSARLLRSRSLLWISLAISAMAAVALFGTYSFSEDGLRVLWFEPIRSPLLAAGTDGPRSLITSIFNGVFVRMWLAWGAILLAVISTAGLLPDFLAGGSIELSLARPISRGALFALRVLGALLFVLAQATIGVGLAYLIIGVRFDLWLHASLLAIPLVTLQFFYLYSVSALIAVATRSTVASLLGTLLFWFAVFLVQFTTKQLASSVAQAEYQAGRWQARIEQIEARAGREGRDLLPAERRAADALRDDLRRYQSMLESLRPWHRTMRRIELAVPKTGDVQKILANLTDAPTAAETLELLGALDSARPPDFDDQQWQDMQRAGIVGQRAIRDVDPVLSLSTSAGFSLIAFVVALGIFRTRDF